MANKPKKHRKNSRPTSKQPTGYNPRGARGSQREKLAKAAGFRSDTEVTGLFSSSGYNLKLITDLQRILSKLLKDKSLDELLDSPVTHHYAGLLHALSSTEITSHTLVSTETDESIPDPSDQRNIKKASLATEALRQVVIESAETPLSMIPSLMADNSLCDKEKIQRLSVYTRSLEMLYEPLQLEPIGEPGEKTSFNGRIHESNADLSSGEPCLIKRIGFTKGDSVIRKAVVEGVQG